MRIILLLFDKVDPELFSYIFFIHVQLCRLKKYYLHSGSTFPAEKNKNFFGKFDPFWKYLWILFNVISVQVNFANWKKCFFSFEKLYPGWKMYFCYLAKLTLKSFYTFFSKGQLRRLKKILFTVGIKFSDWKK